MEAREAEAICNAIMNIEAKIHKLTQMAERNSYAMRFMMRVPAIEKEIDFGWCIYCGGGEGNHRHDCPFLWMANELENANLVFKGLKDTLERHGATSPEYTINGRE